MQVNIEHNPSPAKLEVMYVETWPIWEKEISEFPWSYEQAETCFIIEGEAIVTPDGGEPVTIKENDLVNFPKGLSCQWKIIRPVKKHYLLK